MVLSKRNNRTTLIFTPLSFLLRASSVGRHFFIAPTCTATIIRLRPRFFPSRGVVDRLPGANRVLWIFVVPIKFTMGSPMCFKFDLTLSHMLCPTSSSSNWGQTLDLYVSGEYFNIGGVSKVWSIVPDGQIKETHPK